MAFRWIAPQPPAPPPVKSTQDLATWWPLFALLLTIGFIMNVKATCNSPACKRLSTFGCFFAGAIDFVRTLLLCTGGLKVVYLASNLLFRAIVDEPDAKVNVGIPFKISVAIAVHSGAVQVLSWARESYLASEIGHLEPKVVQYKPNGTGKTTKGSP